MSFPPLGCAPAVSPAVGLHFASFKASGNVSRDIQSLQEAFPWVLFCPQDWLHNGHQGRGQHMVSAPAGSCCPVAGRVVACCLFLDPTKMLSLVLFFFIIIIPLQHPKAGFLQYLIPLFDGK